MSIKIYRGDLTKSETDAIVNAANSSLLGGGGVDGAIHRAAGPELVQECRELHGCKTGQAKITKGYKLKAKHVIHTVGPVYSEDRAELCRKQLTSCYKNSLEIAKQNNCKSVAFPLISAGIYGYPKCEAIDVAIEVLKQYESEMDLSLVLFDVEACDIAQNNYPELWQN